MRKSFLLTFSLFVFIFFFVLNANALQKNQQSSQKQLEEDLREDAISVQADGVGTLKDDVTSARKIAINDALRVAVEQARGIMVRGETEVKDFAEIKDEVISKAKGFVKTYKILKETTEDNVYRVTLEVEVMLSDPAVSAPLKMDEQKYKANVPKLLEEARALFAKTNQIADSLRNKKTG
ncbi:MAG: flagellar assembly protein T N-terminal domain-containing protein [Nitrospirota bacterium]